MESSTDLQDPRAVKVQLALASGHQHTLNLLSDSPLLQDLLTALAANGQSAEEHPPTFFQIPLEDGRSACSFQSTQLVSMVTEPPVLIQTAPWNAALPPAPVLASPYLQIDNFLSPDAQHQLLTYALQHQSEFVESTVTTGEPDYRHSLVSFPFNQSEHSTRFLECLNAHLPQIHRAFHMSPFPIEEIEIQLTASNDGDYFKIHNDGGCEQTASRELTFVYYFYQEPKPFTGGELHFYDHRIENDIEVPATTYRIIEPRNNSLVVFRSCYHHEVVPIQCASQAFGDSRFTINGWIRKQPEPTDQIVTVEEPMDEIVEEPTVERTVRPKRRDSVLEGRVRDEMVLLSPGSKQAFSLNQSSRAIWELCDGNRTVDEISQTLQERYAQAEGDLSGDINTALSKLKEVGMLELQEA